MNNKTPQHCISQVRGGGFTQLGENAAKDTKRKWMLWSD